MNSNLAQVTVFKKPKRISKGITSKTYMQSNESSKKLFKRPRFFDEFERMLIIAKYEQLLANSLSPLATTFDECAKINYKENKIRIVAILLFKLCSITYIINNAVNVFWPTPYIRGLTCNVCKTFGNPILNNLAVCLIFLVVFSYQALFQYFFITGQNSLYQYMYKIKYQLLEYKLNRDLTHKFYRNMAFSSRLYSISFISTWITLILIADTLVFRGYFDPELNFSLTGIIK